MTPPYPPHLFSLYLAVSKRPTHNFRSDFGRGHAGFRYIDHTRIYTNTQAYTYTPTYTCIPARKYEITSRDDYIQQCT